MKNYFKNKKAFTLTELIIVIAIIGVLAAVLIPSLTGYIEKAKMSNDKVLVANINKILVNEEILTGTPNDVTSLKNRLRNEFNIKLETKSKGVHIFYDEAANQVVLGKLTEEGLTVLSDNNSAVKAASGNSVIRYLEQTNQPEKFVQGYWYISDKSEDGLAQALNTIRNPEIVMENDQINYTAIKANIVSAINSLPQEINQVINKMAYSSLIVGQSGEQIIIGDNKNLITNVIFNENVTKLDDNSIKGCTSLSIIEIPNTIKKINISSEDAKNILFVYYDEMSNLVNDMKSDFNLISLSNRKKSIANVEIYENYNEKEILKTEFTTLIIDGIISFSTNINNLIYLSCNSEVAIFTIEGLLYNNELFEPIDGFYKISTKDSNIKLNCVKNENPIIPEAKIMDKYYTLDDALKYANLDQSKNIICLIKDAILEKNASIDKNDILLLPFTPENLITYDNNKLFTYDKISPGIYQKGKKEVKSIYNYMRLYQPFLNKLPVESKAPSLDIVKDVCLNVSGKLIVSSAIKNDSKSPILSPRFNEKYSAKINLLGKISLDNELSELQVFGYVKGDGEIDAKKGKVTENLHVTNYIGDNPAQSANNNQVFPFTKYNIDGIESKLNIYSNSTYTLQTYVSPAGIYPISLDFYSIGKNSIFSPDGEYEIQTKIFEKSVLKEGENKNKIAIKIYNSLKDNKLQKLQVTMFGKDFEAELDNCPFPLYNMDINILEGASMNLSNNRYYIMDNTNINIQSGANLLLDNKKDNENLSSKVIPEIINSGNINVIGRLEIKSNTAFGGNIKASENSIILIAKEAKISKYYQYTPGGSFINYKNQYTLKKSSDKITIFYGDKNKEITDFSDDFIYQVKKSELLIDNFKNVK